MSPDQQALVARFDSFLAKIEERLREIMKEAEQGVLGLLAARLHEPVTGLTQTELRALLAERGLPDDLGKRILNVLSECDFARFSSSAVSESEMHHRLALVENFWPDLASFSPRPAEDA